MKQYLLSWYGITDFKASLGLGKTDGPVLGALKADEYSNIVVLGYSDPNKFKPDDSHGQEYLNGKLNTILNNEHDVPTEESQRFVDEFANSDQAHIFYIKWLGKQLESYGIKTKITFQPVNLEHLNDTEGIYETANICLETISSQKGKKLITFNLSPGTPVMAFVWAFIALRYPNLKKRLIASPQANRPPETIVLPNEWLEWHGRQIKSQASYSDKYDVIFHLFGEQRMPNLLGVKQFSSKQHIFVNSKQFPAFVMKQFVGNAEFDEVCIDPYNPGNVRATILNIIATLPSNIRVGFNLTGGTKLMYAGALAACRRVNATPFYFNSRKNKVINLNDFSATEIVPINSVETFIKLNADDLFISKPGYWKDIPNIGDPKRLELTRKLWQFRYKIHRLYYNLRDYNDTLGKDFSFATKDISVKLKNGKKAEIILDKSAYRFSNWPDFAKYLSGGWLEEFTYMNLKPFLDSGHIKDLRIGLEVSLKNAKPDNRILGLDEQSKNKLGGLYQELDNVFTDGRRLYIVECKAGYLKSDYIMKLQNIARYYGGIEGRAILASCFPPGHKVLKKKIKESKNIQLISGNDFIGEINTLAQRLENQK